MVDIEQYLKQCDTTQMENMLQMIDPEHGIIIDENIGLLGEFESEESEERENLISRNFIANSSIVDKDKSIGRLSDKYSMYTRGEYFKVIDADGCILFDEYIKECGIIYKNNKLYGYIFILKDYKASQVFDVFFDDEAFCSAVVLYVNGKLYINNVTDKEIMSKYEYRPDIKIEYVKPCEYRLEFENTIYYSYTINSSNKISVYKSKQMQL